MMQTTTDADEGCADGPERGKMKTLPHTGLREPTNESSARSFRSVDTSETGEIRLSVQETNNRG